MGDRAAGYQRHLTASISASEQQLFHRRMEAAAARLNDEGALVFVLARQSYRRSFDIAPKYLGDTSGNRNSLVW